MKKHYVRMAIVIGALILVAFVLGAFFFTYVQIQHVNDEYMDACAQNARAQTLGGDGAYDLIACMKQTYSQAWRTAVLYTDSDIGFAGEFFWIEGEKQTISSSDFVWVYYKNEERVDENQFRVILVGSDFEADPMNGELWDIELMAMCDQVFVYEGTMTYRANGESEGKTYRLKTQPVYWDFGTIPTESWTSEPLYGEYIKMARTKDQTELNQEAKEILARIQKDREAGKDVKMSKEGWFSSYYVSYCSSTMDITVPLGLYGVYVFHPVNIVLEKHTHVYILFALILLVLEAMVIIVSRKMYIERKNYEMRSQKLTRSIAHELKTPLAVTKAYVENWEYIDEENRAETAESINLEVDHMTKMVNTLLELSNLDSGSRQLKMEEVELLSLTRSLYRRMEPIARERDMKVEFITDEDEEYLISADLEMMKIAIGNFLSNAIKYGEKSVRITIRGNGRNVHFNIANDGATISKKEIKKIWDPFYKTDKARTNRFGSSGVGLAVNKSILELHKAKYGCRSDEGETEFWFEMKRLNDKKENDDGQEV